MPTANPPADEPRRRFATEVVARLREAGFEALWAGGCVRDLILGTAPADYDVATSATPESVLRLFRRTVPVGVSFGVVRVLGPPGAGEVEVATFRTDGRYLDGRRPETVTFGSPREDASRRDFTINGMFLDPITGTVLDYVGGEADLKAGIVRAIGDPVARFTEDKLRLLRAVRFAARFDFAIEARTHAALVAMAEQVHVVAAERIAQELKRILAHPRRAVGMRLARETGLVAAILPELVALGDVPTGPPDQPGGDLWTRTLRALERLPDAPSFPLALATLLHGAGRALSFTTHAAEPTRPAAEELAAGIADRLARDLKLSNTERARLVWLVAHQHALTEPTALRRAQLKTLLAAPGRDELLALHRAIALAAGGDLSAVLFCETYCRELPDGPLDPRPLLTGADLIERGLEPGPRFKALLDSARERQLEGELTTREAALKWLDMRRSVN